MKRTFAAMLAACVAFACATAFAEDGPFRLGVIGATTSHVPAFVKTINNPDGAEIFQKFEVTAVYPGGTPDNLDSWDRVVGYTQQCADAGLKVYSTIEEMLPEIDGVLLESVDGRLHLEQAKPVIAAKKPLFIDKPMGGSLKDVLEIFQLAKEAGVPVFSSSSLRYVKAYQQMRNDSPIGEILGADATSPCSLNAKHPSLYWYGVHGVESLFTVMGPDCLTVSRTNTPDADFVVGVWEGKKIGTFRGIRRGSAPYSCKVFGAKGVENVGNYEGYEPLLVEICKFFETGIAPVDEKETINIFAFMTAADVSRREKGKTVALADVIKAAQEETRLTVTVTATADGKFLWNDADNEQTFEEFSELRAAVEAELENYDVVRFIFDNRVGMPIDSVYKALDALEDAVLANYLY